MGFIYYQLYPFITKNKYNGINSLQFTSHPEHLHHLVPEVVDHFDGDAAVLGFVEGTAGVAVEGGLVRRCDLRPAQFRLASTEPNPSLFAQRVEDALMSGIDLLGLERAIAGAIVEAIGQ